MNRYFVNSEGTATRAGYSRYMLGVNSVAQADDGAIVQRSPTVLAASGKDLPWMEHFAAAAKATFESLEALYGAARNSGRVPRPGAVPARCLE